MLPARQDDPRPAATTLRAGAIGIGSFLLGLLAAPLPARWRRSVAVLEGSAWREASIPSGLLQALVALGLGFLGYLAWINGQWAAIDEAARLAGERGKDVNEHEIAGRVMMFANPLLPVIYVLTSATGMATFIAWLGGGIRLVHGAITKEVMPDPVLGLVDWVASLMQGRAAHELRERAKDRSPDRLILGADGARIALSIETAAELDWREGNTIIVSGDWYRLVARSESRGPAGIRLRYDLERMPQGVAIRGMRRYDPGHAPEVVSAPSA